jgi:ESCRT-II complex subunit VPS36
VETTTAVREDTLQDALQDLEALRIKAKDMVRLAAELNDRLSQATSASSSPQNAYGPSEGGVMTPNQEPEEATFIRSSLTQLGLHMENAPVTLDMVRDEKKWVEDLGRELGKVLQGSTSASSSGKDAKGLMSERGIIALDEAWGGWNRARGMALIPPSTFLQAIPLLPSYTSPPIHTRTFASGLRVLHRPEYGRSAFAARLAGFLVSRGEKSTLEIAMEMLNDPEYGDSYGAAVGREKQTLSVALTQEMIEDAERDGDACRDDAGECAILGGGSVGGMGGAGEVKWYPNLFLGYAWDGMEVEETD